MKLIKLTRGFFAKVDDEDYEELSKYKWHFKIGTKNKTGYATRGVQENGKVKFFLMHRQIMGFPEGMVIDHKNHDTLDNRKENLKICSQKENLKNRKIKTLVQFDNRQINNKWRVVIGGKYIASYPTQEEAQKVMDEIYCDEAKQQALIDKRTSNRTSQYKGVKKRKNDRLTNKWEAYYKGKTIGYFPTEQEAYEARKQAELNITDFSKIEQLHLKF